ncbi:methyltransferase [Aliidiomarina sedimenti]|uniref:Methyltransferase n=1 Tax=Aliidiomarina sedimenti TaxID=1933879 RepID=A0ABY0C2T6_9GAMM|nr:methyltransferase [Aliidiomarina sedimenti]RUO32126.1 methyltransferase [Aliidiomarina sedimenti]
MSSACLSPYADRLATYAQLLVAYQSYWRFEPFVQASGEGTPWHHEALLSRLNALDAAQIDQIDESAVAQQAFFADFFADIFALPTITQPSSDQQSGFPFWLTNGIGGRKLSQIQAFLAAVPPLSGTALEWCAGKGHLGRLLNYSQGVAVQSVEWQASLCAAGQALALQHDCQQHFTQLDVLTESVDDVVSRVDHALALHACGDLHRRLLEAGSSGGLESLHIAPCCYHLTAADVYQPLSATGKSNDLELSKSELKLAVQGQVTAGERVRRLRHRETLWRLMYQLARERYLGDPEYRSLPSVNKKWFSGQVVDFLRWACQQHDWQWPQQAAIEPLYTDARQRQLEIQRLELVRHVFRRPLEKYLILDRAAFLEEQGYQVKVTEFCDYRVSPRNFLIQARKS